MPNKTWFNKPTSDVEKINVCKQSGYKASEVCKDVEVKYFQKGCNKTKQCPYHKLIHLDETEQYRVTSNCYPVDKMKHVAWFVVSPTQEYFFKQHSLFYKPLPEYLPGCASDMSFHQMDIIYPREGFKIYVPIDQSGKRSNCIFKAAHKKNNVTIYWHLDGTYIGSTQKFHQLSILPEKGLHMLELTDDAGESVKCKFEVIDKN